MDSGRQDDRRTEAREHSCEDPKPQGGTEQDHQAGIWGDHRAQTTEAGNEQTASLEERT